LWANADVLNHRESVSYIYRCELGVKFFQFPVQCSTVLPFSRQCLKSTFFRALIYYTELHTDIFL